VFTHNLIHSTNRTYNGSEKFAFCTDIQQEARSFLGCP